MTSGTPERPQNPPTIRQPVPGSGRPATPPRQNPSTILQPGAANGTGAAGVNGAGSSARWRDEYFPDALRGAYEPLERRGAGGEAAVWRARQRVDGREVAVKVYWLGKDVDFDLLRHLNQPRFAPCVPELYDFGATTTPYGDVGWVAMEFFEVTLDELIASERATAGLQQARAGQIVAGLADTIAFWQDEIDRTPIDLKPDNIGVLAGTVERFVIFDFGGVVRHTITQRVGDVIAASGYMAPEGLIGERDPKSPWWSLGVIALEMLTGHSRFRTQDGSLLGDRAVRRDLALGEFDFSDIDDERWLLLLYGLLTRDPDDRWGRDEVREWLHGGSPPVIRPVAYGGPQAATPVGMAEAPIDVNGRSFMDPVELALYMLDYSGQAARWLTANAGRLRTWLREDVHHGPGGIPFDTGYLLAIENGAAEHAPRVILSFGAAYLRRGKVTPRYRDRAISAEGLTALCESGAEGVPVLRELIDSDVLGIAAAYRCQHRECQVGGRCLRLDRAAAEVPSTLSDAASLIGGDQRGRRAAPMTSAERDSILPISFLLSLDPADGRRRVLRRVSSPRRLSRAWAVSWWRGNYLAVLRADPQTSAGRASLAAADLLQQRAVTVQAADRTGRLHPIRLPEFTARRGWGALLGIVALTLLCWSAAVLGTMNARHAGQVMSHRPAFAAVGRELGGLAAGTAFRLIPLFALIAIACFLVRPGRGLLIFCAAGVAGVGFAAARVPRFPAVAPPHALAKPLDSFGKIWAQSVGVAAVVCAIAAVIAVLVAGNLLRPRAARLAAGGGVGEWLARLPGGWRRLICGGATFVVAQVLLWATTVVRETVSGPPLPGAVVGADAADMQSGLLICCVVAAVTTALLRPTGARWVLCLTAVGAVGVSGWPQLLGHIQTLWHPADTAGLAGVATTWGASAFWAAVLCYLPLAALGMRAAFRANERGW
jgi:Protein kinase domain